MKVMKREKKKKSDGVCGDGATGKDLRFGVGNGKRGDIKTFSIFLFSYPSSP